MAEDFFTSKYTGPETDRLLDHTQSLKDQDQANDGETVQVYDINGTPHKVAKTELLTKSALALPSINDISSFIAVNAAGNAIGRMSKEQVAEVLSELELKKREIGFVEGYTQLTNSTGYGNMLIYVTGDNKQSLLLVSDTQRVIMILNQHSESDLAIYRKENGGYYIYTASYKLSVSIIYSSFKLNINKGQSSEGLIKINRV